MSSNAQPIDIEFDPIDGSPQPTQPDSGTSENVIAFRSPSVEASTEPPEHIPGTTTELSEAHGVSERTIREWMKRFAEVVPQKQLTSGKRGTWSSLAVEMCADWVSRRGDGVAIDEWLDTDAGVYAPDHIAEAEAFVFEAEKAGSLVPRSLTSAASQDQALALAEQEAANAKAFMGAVFDAIQIQTQTATGASVEIDRQGIIADEMLKIAEEERVRAEVRAEYLHMKNAAAAKVRAQRMQQAGGEA